MKKTGASDGDVPCASGVGITTLVISQHEVVRRLLVTYLGRSPALVVSGDAFSPEAIVHAHPNVLVLDLSQLGQAGLRQASRFSWDATARATLEAYRQFASLPAAIEPRAEPSPTAR